MFDGPAISVESKTNEQNLQILKGYLNDMADQMNYQISNLQSQINALQAQVDSIKEG